MDLSSHGRKRRGQEDPDRKDREEESEISDNKKGKKDTKTQKSEMDENKTEPQPFQFVPPILRHRSHSPFPPFPRPYDLSMNIQGMRRPEESRAAPTASPSTTTASQEKETMQPLSTSSDPLAFLTRKQDDLACAVPSSQTKHVNPTGMFPPNTRQSSDGVTTPSCQASIPSSLQQPLPSRPSYPTHFHKGSLIQLASGHMKKVEELETEDFISSARSNQDVTLDHSTLVKIDKNVTLGFVDLTFKVGRENLQVTVSATEDHPFFVYGGTWSSISPNMSMARYSLSCSQLSLGDVCISLTSSRISLPLPDLQEGKAGGSTLSVPSQVITTPSESTTTVRSSVTSSVSDSTTVTYSMSASAVSTTDISATLNVATGRKEETDNSNTRGGHKTQKDVVKYST